VPASAVGKVVKTTVKKVDTLVARVAAARGPPVLLMLDGAQALAESPEGASIMASLRAVSQKRKRDALAVFTGSSQDALVAMMDASGGPMYQFAQLLNFPVLGDYYLNLLAHHSSRVHKSKRLDLAVLERLKRVGILSGTGGEYLIVDPLLVDYLFANGPDRLL